MSTRLGGTTAGDSSVTTSYPARADWASATTYEVGVDIWYGDIFPINVLMPCTLAGATGTTLTIVCGACALAPATRTSTA